MLFIMDNYQDGQDNRSLTKIAKIQTKTTINAFKVCLSYNLNFIYIKIVNKLSVCLQI